MWKKGRSVLAEALRPKPPSVPNGAQNSVPSLRSIGSASNQAAPGTIAANDFLVKTASSTLSAERVVTDTASVTWDWSTAGQAKANASAGGISPLTTKGDVWGYSTGNARIPVGSNGQVLTADSTAALGVSWSTPAAVPVTSVFGRTGAVVAQNGDYTAAQVGAVPTTRNVNTSAPLTGGGALSADLTIAIPAASGAANGYLSSADWTTFNGKAASVVTTKGDLYTYSTVAARLGVGADGQVLTADSTAATGLKWAASASGITQLTGDVTAGPGSGSQAATLASTAVAAGSYGSSTSVGTFTVDAKGRLTAAADAAIPSESAAGTAALRKLGTSSTAACAGDDARLSDSRAPTGSAGGDLTGTYPNPTIGANKVTFAKFVQASATKLLVGRNTAGSGNYEEVTASQLLDWITATRGDLLARGAATWGALAIGTAGKILRAGASDPGWANGSDFFGDGSDGSLAYDGSSTILGVAPVANVYTINRDIMASAITISSGVTIKTAGFIIYCSGTLTFTDSTSIIQADGTAGSGSTGAAQSGQIGSWSSNNGPGANGRTGTTGAGSAATGTTNAVGGAGGNGGSAGGGAGGGSGASGTAPAAALGSTRTLQFLTLRRMPSTSNTAPVAATYGQGGGGGGLTHTSGTGNGGGGGSGGLHANVWARFVSGAGVISADGGAGAPGTATGADVAGGGGGGGGGYASLVTSTPSPAVTLRAAGGAGGAGAGGGSTGSTGSAGTTFTYTI